MDERELGHLPTCHSTILAEQANHDNHVKDKMADYYEAEHFEIACDCRYNEWWGYITKREKIAARALLEGLLRKPLRGQIPEAEAIGTFRAGDYHKGFNAALSVWADKIQSAINNLEKVER